MKRRFVIAMAVLLLATAVYLAHPALASPGTCWIKEEGEQCRGYIGKRLWVFIPPTNPNVVEVTFTKDDWTTARTLKLKSGASFIVRDLVAGKFFKAENYLVELNDGRKGWVSASSPFLLDYDPIAKAKKDAEECVRRGQPKIGMTTDELVASCWGKPRRIVKRTTAAGVQENYVYGLGYTVTVVDGKVAEIIETK